MTAVPASARGPGLATLTGVGLGLRAPHMQFIEQHRPKVPWFELLIDNYLDKGGPAVRQIDRLRRDYPLSFHGVGLSLGSTDPLNRQYLRALSRAIARWQPVQVSDHLCWTSAAGRYAHELLPMPYTEAAAQHVALRIRQVQDVLGRRILIENVSSYLSYRASAMSEADFLCTVLDAADCDLLLDVNNVYVSARNHGFDAEAYLAAMPAARVKEIHLAGFEDHGSHLLDSHSAPVQPAVWRLYRRALQRFGAVPTLIEWDQAIPPFPRLQAEAARARCLLRAVCRDVA